MNLTANRLEEKCRKLKTTVLYREGGTWAQLEISRIVNHFTTSVTADPKHPEYLIVSGHHTKEQILGAILGGVAFTAKQVTGISDLPFSPGLI